MPKPARMGRPPIPKSRRRDRRVYLYMETSLWKWIERKAREDDETVSHWIHRILAAERARDHE